MSAKRQKVKSGIWKRQTSSGQWRYEAQARDAAGVPRRRVADSLREAEALLAEMVLARRSGDLTKNVHVWTFAEAATAWMGTEVVRLRPSTRRTYEHNLAHVLPVFGHRRLDQISPGDVADYVATKEGEGLKAWSIRGHLTVVRRTFAYATRRMGYTGTSPAMLLDRSERPRMVRQERRVLSGEELGRLLTAAEEPYRTAFATAAATGVRLGELLGLLWGRVDLEEQVVHVLSQRTRGGTVDHVWVPGGLTALKTHNARRTLQLPVDVVAMLRAHRERSEFTDAADYVFCREGGEPLDHSNVGAVLRATVKAAKIVVDDLHPPVTTHTLRRSFASRLIAGGCDLVELSKMLGHGDVATTARSYLFAFEETQRAEARRARLEDAFAGVFSGGGFGVATPAPETASQAAIPEDPERLGRVAHDGDVEVALAREVVVEQALRDPGALGDQVDADGVVRLGSEDLGADGE